MGAPEKSMNHFLLNEYELFGALRNIQCSTFLTCLIEKCLLLIFWGDLLSLATCFESSLSFFNLRPVLSVSLKYMIIDFLQEFFLNKREDTRQRLS
jgi:hypothetical protein